LYVKQLSNSKAGTMDISKPPTVSKAKPKATKPSIIKKASQQSESPSR